MASARCSDTRAHTESVLPCRSGSKLFCQLLGTLLRERCDAERSECRMQALPHAFARFAFWPYGGSLVPISSTFHPAKWRLRVAGQPRSLLRPREMRAGAGLVVRDGLDSERVEFDRV